MFEKRKMKNYTAETMADDADDEEDVCDVTDEEDDGFVMSLMKRIMTTTKLMLSVKMIVRMKIIKR